MIARALPPHVAVPSLAEIGIEAFITTRQADSFALSEQSPAGDEAATGRWHELQQALARAGGERTRLASARQVHGTRVLTHRPSDAWDGWLRVDGADGHLLLPGAGAAAITVADCVPVFLAHPDGAAAVVHAGWRGVASGIVAEAVRAFAREGMRADELVVHFGPSICGRCYEVGPDVYEKLTGFETRRPRQVDLRSLLAEQVKELGVTRWSASGECTLDDNDRFYSHRAGDAGRQVAVIVAR
ncbi:MAG TPA: polyphenol oxidase family protein [Gemmatimonadaceae bacterium]|nr:polyphenol oxidase family protein [Gemmatimonadaceae bacterium]